MRLRALRFLFIAGVLVLAQALVPALSSPASATTGSGPTITTTASLPSGTVGVPYSATIQWTSFFPPDAVRVISGKLPPGLSGATSFFNGTFKTPIRGTPTAPGTYLFTVQVTDQLFFNAQKLFVITIVPGTPTLAFTGAGVAGTAPSQTATATYGSPYTLSATSNSTGAVSFSEATAGTTACSLSGTALTFAGTGTCVADASVAATGTYVAASTSLAITVVPEATTTSVTSSVDPSTTGTAVTFTAAVSPSAATGTVAFSATGSTIAGCAAERVVAGRASCTTAGLRVGTHAIEAAYSSSPNYVGSQGTTAQTVNETVVSPTSSTSSTSSTGTTPASQGYYEVATDGGIFTFGGARFLGSEGGKQLNAPIVGMASTPTGGGYWLVASDGGIFAFGKAQFLGSEGGTRLNAPIVGMASTPTGGGYWLVASDGGIFAFGKAQFLGSEGGTRLNAPIVGMASTPTGGGYWLVASDGGIFAFGKAQFFGSMSGQGHRVVSVLAAGSGYDVVSATGTVESFAGAADGGLPTDGTHVADIVGASMTRTGKGYWLYGADGGVFSFGSAQFHTSEGGKRLNAPVVGGATS